jgi:hypothetical protein
MLIVWKKVKGMVDGGGREGGKGERAKRIHDESESISRLLIM